MDRLSMEEPSNLPLFRSYLQLVSEHFRSKHKVAEYADLLHKSPKTLVNTFSKRGLPKPIDVLHGRLVMESIALITNSNKPIRQLAADVGYFDLDTFSRCFKRKTGLSPQNFRLSLEENRSFSITEIISPEIYALLKGPLEEQVFEGNLKA